MRPMGAGPTAGRLGTTRKRSGGAHGRRKRGDKVHTPHHFLVFKEFTMPIIAWLLGVPLSVVLLLMLFGVF